MTNGLCEVLTVQLLQRSTHIFCSFTYIHPPFCVRVIHALLCTSLASPSVFKRLLQWENEIGTSFVSKLRPCVVKLPLCSQLCSTDLHGGYALLCVLCLLLLSKAHI